MTQAMRLLIVAVFLAAFVGVLRGERGGVLPVGPTSTPTVAVTPPASTVTVSGVYSYQQLSQALQATGMTLAAAKVGAAIAEAESSGRALAICDSCAGVREYSVGPWQINLIAHPSVSAQCAEELNCAARAAAAISSGGRNWNPWSTFTSGKYRRYLQ
jgi:hypothetical protein